MRVLSIVIGIYTLALGSACLAAEGKLALELRKETAKECRAEVLKINPKSDSKVTDAYCQCYARELVAGINDADIGALMDDRETPNFTKVSEQSIQLCQERHILTAVQTKAKEFIKDAKYEELPDLGNPDIVRTKSGVYAMKPTEKLAILADNEQLYMLRTEKFEYACGWMASPLGKQSSHEISSEIKTLGQTLAKSLLKSPDAEMRSFEEANVNGRPTVFMELRGNKTSASGETKEQVMLYAGSIDNSNGALVNGFCFSDANQYEKSKGTMRKLSAAARSARRYKN